MAPRSPDSRTGLGVYTRESALTRPRPTFSDEVDRAVVGFAQEWFNDLSLHVPVDRLLTRLSDTGLEMVFPDATLRSRSDFAGWYAGIGRSYTDQTHVLEGLEIERIDPWTDLIEVAVTVGWAATSTADGTRSAFLFDQFWRLRAVPEHRMLIVTYHVTNQRPIALIQGE